MSPEEVTELSPEEQVYFFLLEQHLMGVPDLPEIGFEPVSPLVNALVWCVVGLICCVPWVALGVIVWVILT